MNTKSFDATDGYTKAAYLFEKYGFWTTDMHYMNFVDAVKASNLPEANDDLAAFGSLYPELNLTPAPCSKDQINSNRARLGLPI